VHDLDTLLERLAADATRDAVAPEVAAIAHRGRRRRRRQLAGSAALVAAVVAAGLVLPARLAGRSSADRPLPATVPATDVAGAATIGGYWFGKADASVFLDEGVTPARRAAIRKRIESLKVVDRIYYESQTDAWARFREVFKNKPEMIRNFGASALPESFRVRLQAPEQFPALRRALCPSAPSKASGSSGCLDGVDSVIAAKQAVAALLLPRSWTTSTDVTVFLPVGTTAPARDAVRARLAAIDGVATVTWESPEEAYRRLPEKLRRDGRDPAKVTPLFTPEAVPGAFHVTLDGPARVEEFHLALCGSRRTGECAGGLVVFEHPRRRQGG
jgi:cell division protein FtsX